MHGRVARLVAGRADAITCVSEAISEETRALEPEGPRRHDPERRGLRRRRRARVHARASGSGSRTRAASSAAAIRGRSCRRLHDSGLDVVARFLGDFRETDRAWAADSTLGDRLELLPYAPRVESLALQRDSEALLLLIPEAGGRGKGVLSGKVFEYIAVGRPILAAVPPDGAAAELIRETGAGVVAAPDDPARSERRSRSSTRAGATAACRTSSSRRVARPALAPDARRGDGGGAARGTSL